MRFSILQTLRILFCDKFLMSINAIKSKCWSFGDRGMMIAKTRGRKDVKRSELHFAPLRLGDFALAFPCHL